MRFQNTENRGDPEIFQWEQSHHNWNLIDSGVVPSGSRRMSSSLGVCATLYVRSVKTRTF